MTDFTTYTDANLTALKASSKASEIISRKQSILDGVYEFYNFVPSTILFVGFNPAILSCKQEIFVTEISKAALEFLDESRVKYTVLADSNRKFDVVVAADEYFTFADCGQSQQDKVANICKLASEFVISTLRDYKNQDFKDREFSVPAVVRSGQSNSVIYNEFHNWSLTNRSQWESKVYQVDSSDNLTVYGPFKRHTMYFKQLAKFSMDAGADNFVVHKNLMYKSPIKKNYEHVISIKFEEAYEPTNRSNIGY